MSHLPRLLKITSAAAKYRLHQLSPLTARSWVIRSVMAIVGLPWTGNAARHLSPEQRLRTALEELGPIYIKFGQLLSTRRDFLPHALAD
ncbi:MAG: ubiquinone biosynthesis regulatory protein kinase UbiB, partial [Pseudohongiella sp.]